MKKYIQPSIDIAKIELQHIMAGSGVATGDSVGDEYKDTDVTYGKSNNLFGGDYDSDIDPTPQTFNVWED